MTKNSSTLSLTRVAMIGAIIVIMAFTPLGYLKIGPLSITFLSIPVVIGAILLGVKDGAVLGGIFGITSFVQCFGMDAFGTALMSINPIFMTIVCIVPRILIGVFTALIYKALEKVNVNNLISYAISALIGACTNTVFFVGFLLILFENAEPVRALGENAWKIIGVLVTTNSLIEALVCVIVSTVIVRACAIVKRRGR